MSDNCTSDRYRTLPVGVVAVLTVLMLSTAALFGDVEAVVLAGFMGSTLLIWVSVEVVVRSLDTDSSQRASREEQ